MGEDPASRLPPLCAPPGCCSFAPRRELTRLWPLRYAPPRRHVGKDHEMFPRNPVALHPSSEVGRARDVQHQGLRRTDLTGGSWEVSRAGQAPQAADPRRRTTEATRYGQSVERGAHEQQNRLPQNHSWEPPPPLKREFGVRAPCPRGLPSNDLDFATRFRSSTDVTNWGVMPSPRNFYDQ